MNKFILSLLIILPFCAVSQTHWQQEMEFRIDVSLNDIENSLDGFEKIKYSNNSPDTLRYLWFQLMPNAFRNDRSFYSEQRLQNGKTDFYFSNKDERGYINRLAFRIDGELVSVKDHPLYLDVIMLELPKALAPHQSVTISTPFHVQLPHLYSGFGHLGQFYMLRNWYPRPAVYDKTGWHPYPLADQGAGYYEYGNYEVSIQVPRNYVVAASATLVSEVVSSDSATPVFRPGSPFGLSAGRDGRKTRQGGFLNKQGKKRMVNPDDSIPASETSIKTLTYTQSHLNAFSWIADKRLSRLSDSLAIGNKGITQVQIYYMPSLKDQAGYYLSNIKAVMQYRNATLGAYPYKNISVVIFPTLNYFSPLLSVVSPQRMENVGKKMDESIGQNWFGGMISSNENEFPWIAMGLNSYYNRRFVFSKYNPDTYYRNKIPYLQKIIGTQDSMALPTAAEDLRLRILTSEHRDQPISTQSNQFTVTNYKQIAGNKSASWFTRWQDSLGYQELDHRIQSFLTDWRFGHPYPEDLELELEKRDSSKWVSLLKSLDNKGPLPESPFSRKATIVFQNGSRFRKTEYPIGINPVLGFNEYDQLMPGLIIHNLTLPTNRFQFLIAPLYSFHSKQLNGTGTLSYSWYPQNHFQKITGGIAGARFSSLSGTDSNQSKIFGGFYTLVPYLRMLFKNKDARSTVISWLEWKTFLIGEKGFTYNYVSRDSAFFPSQRPYDFRYLNQLSFGIEDRRKLYPYDFDLQAQQASAFYRINLTGHYFFNYGQWGGMQVRMFAAKFGYIGGYSSLKEAQTFYYQPKLTAVRGNEDYSYSNYFFGRNEQTGFESQQIMMRDGGLKLRTDLFENLQGRSDNWIASINLNSSLPPQLIPKFIPLKLFLDIGTYSGGWSANPPTSKFLYVGGLQLSLFRNIVNIYAPLIYSSDFRDQLKTVPDQNKFWQKVSFSIDLQNIRFQKFAGESFAL